MLITIEVFFLFEEKGFGKNALCREQKQVEVQGWKIFIKFKVEFIFLYCFVTLVNGFVCFSNIKKGLFNFVALAYQNVATKTKPLCTTCDKLIPFFSLNFVFTIQKLKEISK